MNKDQIEKEKDKQAISRLSSLREKKNSILKKYRGKFEALKIKQIKNKIRE